MWAQKNGCDTTDDGAGGRDAAAATASVRYDGCPSDGQVALCTFTGMGHCYAGGGATSSRHGDIVSRPGLRERDAARAEVLQEVRLVMFGALHTDLPSPRPSPRRVCSSHTVPNTYRPDKWSRARRRSGTCCRSSTGSLRGT